LPYPLPERGWRLPLLGWDAWTSLCPFEGTIVRQQGGTITGPWLEGNLSLHRDNKRGVAYPEVETLYNWHKPTEILCVSSNPCGTAGLTRESSYTNRVDLIELYLPSFNLRVSLQERNPILFSIEERWWHYGEGLSRSLWKLRCWCRRQVATQQ